MSRAHPLPVTALVGADGCILRADGPLMDLQIEAGGQPHGPFALPALASLVRLAQRLGIPLSRSVELARDDADISLWAELRPDGGEMLVTLHDWQERRPRLQASRAGALQMLAPKVEPGWEWQVDDQMRFAAVEVDETRFAHRPPQEGETFTAFFALDDMAPHGERAMPMIEALVRHVDFEAQAAHLRGDEATKYVLSGTALFDQEGRFSGYKGRALRPDEVPRKAETAAMEVALTRGTGRAELSSSAGARATELFGPSLGQRLDTALRQPISRIIANAGSISERINGPLREDYASYASDIASAGRHLLALVDDLADLHAIEAPGFRPVSEEVDLADLARRAAGLLNVRADARRIVIQGPAPDEQLLAKAEYRRVLQILVNLVGNAVRHGPADSTIWIRLDEENGRARVVVADQGSGIDPADHGRIFERFERLGNSEADGSGLGLYISRKLARGMGGDIMIDSALGSGARFTLDLPAWTEARTGTQAG